MNDYVESPRIVYGDGMQFVRVCSKCGRFVKADPSVMIRNETLADVPNATCSKCGRVKMIFEGWFSVDNTGDK